MAFDYVLFPGRHHLLTRFQAAYLERAVAVGVLDTEGAQADCRGAQVIFAVTSADHGTTRRNPLPAHRREAQIERYATLREAGERDTALPWPDTHLRLVARRPAA
jgi:hypothetical protein